MTRDEVMRMAREAGIPDPWIKSEQVKRFAALVAEAERKACTELVSSYLVSMSIDIGVTLALRRNK